MLELGRGPLGGLGRGGSAVGQPRGPLRAAPPLLGLASCWMARRSWAPGAGGAGDACWGARRRCWGGTRGGGGARAAELGEWARRAAWALLRAPGRCSVLAVGAGARGEVQFGGGRPGTPARHQCTATIARSRPGALPAPQEGPRSGRGPPGSAAVPAQPHPHSRPSAHPSPGAPAAPPTVPQRSRPRPDRPRDGARRTSGGGGAAATPRRLPPGAQQQQPGPQQTRCGAAAVR